MGSLASPTESKPLLIKIHSNLVIEQAQRYITIYICCVKSTCTVNVFLFLFHTDIVFFIYLYQRWIYRVDPKRINEFGTSGEDANIKGAVTSESSAPDPSISHGELVSAQLQLEQPVIAESAKSLQDKKND